MRAMAIEAGAKSGIIAPDETTIEFVRTRSEKSFEPVLGDEGAEVLATHRFSVADMPPQVAKPHSPSNVVAVGC